MGLWEKGMRQGGQGNWVKEGKGEGKEGEKKVRTNLYPPLTKTFRRACFATI